MQALAEAMRAVQAHRDLEAITDSVVTYAVEQGDEEVVCLGA